MKLASPKDKQPLQGKIRLPPSPHLSVTSILTLAAIGGGVAANVARSFHVEVTVHLLKRLGYKLDWVAADKLMISSTNVNGASKRHAISVGCYPWLLPLLAMFYTAKGSAGSLLVLRGECDWMLKLDYRDVLESIGSIGGKAWPGEKLSSLLVVEGFKGRLPTSLWRIVVRNNIYTIIGTIIAAIATEYTRSTLLRGTTPYTPWLKELINVFNGFGIRISIETGRFSIQLPNKNEKEVAVGSTCFEAALLAAPIAASRGRAKLVGVIDGECVSDLAYTLQSIGCEIEIENKSLTLDCRDREARSLIAKVVAPPLTLPYLGLGIAVKADATLSGISGLVYEGVQLSRFISILEKLGFTLIVERERVVSVVGEEPRKRVIVDCSLLPELCFILIPPALSPDIETEIVFNNIETVESIAPGFLEALWSLGANFRQLG